MMLLRCLSCPFHFLRKSCKKYSMYGPDLSVFICQQFYKDGNRQLLHSVQQKSYFTTLAYLKTKKSETSENSKYACENGKGAVPHSELVFKLQNCSSVSKQIEIFSSVLSLTDEDKEKRAAFCKSLEDVFKFYLLNHKIYIFGSSFTGIGFKGCDFDVCLQTNVNDKDYAELIQIPTLEDVKSGLVSREIITRLSPLHMSKFIKSVLECCPDVTDIVRINGRCPILKFYSSKYDIFCDLSFGNKFSLQNTAMIHFLGKLDQRFIAIIRIVRYWAKYCGLVDGLSKFSSYALSLLVIHFLQTRKPSILPPVNEIVSKSEYVQSGSIEDTQLLLEDLKKFSRSINSQSVEELLREFFFYYMTFDFDSQVMVPARGCSVPADPTHQEFAGGFQFNAVNIQDPFKTNVNITVAAQHPYCVRFIHCLHLACAAFQNKSLWTPGSETFGLCSLFFKPSSISKRFKELKENTLHTIEVPPIPDAASKIQKILQHGLLFDCNSFNTVSNNSSDSNTLLKLRCKTYNRTWYGRDLVNGKIHNRNNLSPLEKEHLISKEIVSKTDKKEKQVLCEFDCECKESVEDNETKLTLYLNFKKSGLLSIFLKEYISCTLRML